MPMPSYPVLCYSPGCGEPAVYKIAAAWSDGITKELKTYYLSCPACLQAFFTQAKAKQAVCRLIPGESLGAPEVYELRRGTRDQELIRRSELE